MIAKAILGLGIAFLAGCADIGATFRVQPGVLDESDTICESVPTASGGLIFTRLRVGVEAPPAILTCADARRAVQLAQAMEPIASLMDPWTVEFTMGAPGWTMKMTDDPSRLVDLGYPATSQSLRPVPVLGETYPETRVIEVSAVNTWILAHEFGHALDIEQGRPNTRDGVRR